MSNVSGCKACGSNQIDFNTMAIKHSPHCPWHPENNRSVEEKPGLTMVDRMLAPDDGHVVSTLKPKQELSAGVVQLHKSKPAMDIPETLRRIADEIERGEKMEVVTAAVLLLGHTFSLPSKADPNIESFHAEHELYGIGPRVDLFTIRGLLSHALIRMGAEG